MKKLTYLIAASALGAIALTTMAISASPGNGVSAIRQNAGATRSLDEPLVPDEVKDVSIVWDMSRDGFGISFTAPTQGSYYDWNSWTEVYGDLESISRIDVSINNGYNMATTWPQACFTLSRIRLPARS